MKKIALILSLALLLTFTACNNENAESKVTTDDLQTNIMQVVTFEISTEEVNQKLQNNEQFHLIDVRTIEERAEGHLTDTDFISSVEIEAGIADFSKYNKDDEIVVYCRSGNRSGRVYNVMTKLGFTNVKSMAGGITKWNSLGYNTVSE